MRGETEAAAEPPLLALLQRVVLWFTEQLKERLAEVGIDPITPAHVTVLAHLDDEAPVSIAELARRASVTRQTMHRAVMQLVDEGLLTSRPGHGYPRSSLIELTPAGHQRRTIASGILRALEGELAVMLGGGAVAGMRASLMRAWPASVAESNVAPGRGESTGMGQ